MPCHRHTALAPLLRHEYSQRARWTDAAVADAVFLYGGMTALSTVSQSAAAADRCYGCCVARTVQLQNIGPYGNARGCGAILSGGLLNTADTQLVWQ